MKIGTATVLALWLLASGSPLPAWADPESKPGCRDAVVTALQQRYESAKDFRADIVQTTRSVTLGTDSSEQMTSKGTVVFAKPGKMRWSYEEPEPSLVISDGETLWIYDLVFREAQKFPATDGFMSGAAIQFLLGNGEIERDFEISALRCETAAAELLLVPREPSSYEKLHVLVNPQNGDLLKTTVFFVLGNVTEVAFSNIELNRNPAASVFRLDPPADVRVIELGEPSQ
ncbi:MAG: outer membrane lipoprotein carrier protein LolA [Deltaproteobacteria bacterium]|nr:outer membrane lipoprotein carrier protein LolA [Deltaproteobacteria bacterium]